MIDFVYWCLIAAGGLALGAGLLLAAFMSYVLWKYLGTVTRIFEEKPLFLTKKAPRNEYDTEETRFATTHGLTLAGSYLRTPAERRRGVVLFCPEFAAPRMTCLSYAKPLLEAGFDVFTFDFRNQGDSDALSGYVPQQWVTNHEVADVEAALAHLKERFDAPAGGIGLFGVSRGAGAGVIAGAKDPWVRCFVTDGMFGTMNTVVFYMRKWIEIYADISWVRKLLPEAFYRALARCSLWHVGRKRGCWFPTMKPWLPRLAPRPLLMIHGQADSYIKPAIGEGLFNLARAPKDFWLVDGAKHNQAVLVEPREYARRLTQFFAAHLAPEAAVLPSAPSLAVGL